MLLKQILKGFADLTGFNPQSMKVCSMSQKLIKGNKAKHWTTLRI